MLVRVRASGGMARLEAEASDTVLSLFEKAAGHFKVTEAFKLSKKPDGSQDFKADQQSQSLEKAGIKHGDIVYLVPKSQEEAAEEAAMGPAPTVLDPVDVALSAKDGLIPRKRDPTMCRHGDNSLCLHCTALEPFDPTVLQAPEPPIKFLSFHSYLRKLNSGGDKGKFSSLEETRCTIKPGCLGHAPWPDGICTKCQPSAVTLKRQEFRHVDFLQYENKDSLGSFLDTWRASGCQRVGFMYGYYDTYDDTPYGVNGVPLGIKAVVLGIYEPPQANERDGLEFLDDPNRDTFLELLAALDLQEVGWIFTDLDPLEGGKVKHKRFIHLGEEEDDTTLFHAMEVITAGHFQCEHPNPVEKRYNHSGVFGSKFVTAVVTGNQEEMVDTLAFQATDQAMSLTRADILRPTEEAHNLCAVKESSAVQYVPDVFYVEKDKYGNEIKKAAKPSFPIEFLYTTLATGANLSCENPRLERPSIPFVIENRQYLGEIQSMSAVARHFKQSGSFLSKISDVHLLLYLMIEGYISSKLDAPLFEAIRERRADGARRWEKGERWQTVKLILESAPDPTALASPSVLPSSAGVSSGSAALWACKHCTLLNNPSVSSCVACGLPK